MSTLPTRRWVAPPPAVSAAAGGTCPTFMHSACAARSAGRCCAGGGGEEELRRGVRQGDQSADDVWRVPAALGGGRFYAVPHHAEGVGGCAWGVGGWGEGLLRARTSTCWHTQWQRMLAAVLHIQVRLLPLLAAATGREVAPTRFAGRYSPARRCCRRHHHRRRWPRARTATLR